MIKQTMATSIASDLISIREKNPIIHNITNYVVMNNSANALLALGASPIMAHAVDELDDLLSFSNSLLINLGTLDQYWMDSMLRAAKIAQQRAIPIIVDPVGAGASRLRTDFAKQLFTTVSPAVIRGNASEIMALIDDSIKTKGVDSAHSEQSALPYARQVAKQYNTVVVVSGARDICTDGEKYYFTDNGHVLMTKVTGMGCTASAIIAAFCSVNGDSLQAAAHAMSVMGICGELAEQSSNGPGSLQVNFYDQLYQLNSIHIQQLLRISDE